jgi:hypothetical protein
MTPKNLQDIWFIYKDSIHRDNDDSHKVQAIINQTQTALIRYTLPGWHGPIPQGRKITKSELECAIQFMGKVSLKQFSSALAIQAKVFDDQNIKSSIRHTYEHRLKRLMTWSNQQIWWPAELSSTVKNRSPNFFHGFGDGNQKKTTSRHRMEYYTLKSEEIPHKLCLQIDRFYSFLTQSRWPRRLEDPMRPKVAKQHVERLYRILGWFVRYARPIYDELGNIIAYSDDPSVPLVPIDELSFDLLVPRVYLRKPVDKEAAIEAAQKAADSLDIWLCKFLDFLEIERESQSAKSLSVMVTTVHALVRFQYYTETNRSDYQDIPAMGKIKQHFSFLRQKMKLDKPVSNIELQWLELPDVWQRVVRPLREECSYRSRAAHLRSISAISKSFQLFVLWGMLTFRPPRRQQEFRELKISLSCPLNKPSGLVSQQFIHPLPQDRDVDKYSGYLYKAEDGMWYMDMTPESYKTGKIYGHQKLRIPNAELDDHKFFYDYLEAFLYGYYRDSSGNWISGGQLVDKPDEEELCCLRMTLEPKDNHVFVQPTTGNPLSESDVTRLIQTSAHRLTGQKLPPHLLRDIFATWFLDQGYSPDRIASLAYAMGHREETLRKIYDRRKPKDKNRPIEETLAELVQQFVN